MDYYAKCSGRGHEFLRAGDFNEAINEYYKAIDYSSGVGDKMKAALYCDLAKAYEERALIKYQNNKTARQSDFVTALQYYLMSLQLDPSCPAVNNWTNRCRRWIENSF